MTVWTLERLRLVRTRRLMALMGIYAFFGIVGPLTARYLGEIIDRFGSDITVIVPEPTPVDGIAQYVANASQIGLLVAVAVAAGALTIDAIPEMSIFLRTRLPTATALVLPRYVTVTVAVALAYTVGLMLAWYETAVLLGGIDVVRLLTGLGFGLIYLAFALALAAAVGTRVSSVLATVGLSVVVLLVMPIIGIAESVGRWLPSHLVGAQVDLLASASVADFVPAAAITAALSAGLLTTAIRAAGSREL